MIDIKKLIEVYGDQNFDWGELSEFKGNYINFGYWKNINFDGDITLEQRIRSSKELYLYVIDKLGIASNDTVVEIGCGRGVGIVELLLNRQVKKVIAVDLSHNQIKIAIDNLKNINDHNQYNIEFIQGSAENTRLEDESIDKVFTVEAAHHFSSIDAFTFEMKRILKPGGKLCMVTYFPKNKLASEKFKTMLRFINEGLETAVPVVDVAKSFVGAGFRAVAYKEFGEHVFHGFDKWVSQVNSDNEVSRVHYSAYCEGLIDYYIFEVC